MKDFNLQTNLTLRKDLAFPGLRAVLMVLLIAFGIGNAWGSNTTYKSTMKTAVAPTGAGTAYVKSGRDGVGTSTTTSANGSEASRFGATTQTYSIQANAKNGYMFKEWTKDNNVKSIASTTSSATTAQITGSESGKTGTVTANFYTVTVANASAVELSPTNPSTSCEDYTGSVTFTTNYADAKEDFKTPTFGSASGNGTFTVTDYSFTQGSGTAGTVTVNYKFVGKGHFGSDSNPRKRSNSATLTLTSAGGENSGTCSFTANFPNITITAGEGEPFNATVNEAKDGTATFAVAWADDKNDFTAAFSNKSTGSTWEVKEITYADGVVTVTYTFNSTVANDHSATLTLSANSNAGGASNTVNLSVTSTEKANHDASVTYNNTTTKFSTIAAAIAEANTKPGAIVTLLRSIPSETTPSLSSPLNITGTMTLDLNGFTLARTGMADGSQQVVTVNMANAESVLTIKSTDAGGKISGTGNSNSNMLYAVCMENGVLNVESGVIECTNTNTGTSAKATGIRVKNGCKLLMQDGTINATTSGSPARGIYATTTSANAQMVVVSGGTINTKAATISVGIDCESMDTPSTIDPDPTKANVILSGVTVDAQTTGTTEAYAVRSAAGVLLGIQNGSYTATAGSNTAAALKSSGHTAILGGTFNANVTNTTAYGIWVAAGITAVKGGTITANAATDAAYGAYIPSGAKLLTYGGTLTGHLSKVGAEKKSAGAYVVAGGTLEAQGGTFIGEAANTTLTAAQKAYACGVYGEDGNSTISMSNAILRGDLQSTYLTNGSGGDSWTGGAYGFYARSTNPLSLTNCTVTANSAYQGGFGLRFANTPVEVKNCTVTVTTTYAYNYGVFVGGASCNVKLYNSSFTCTSGTTYAYGLYAYNGSTYAENCSFSAKTNQSTATSAADCYLYGVKVNTGKSATLNGCTVTATGKSTLSNNGYGIYVDGTASIEDTKVTVLDINSGAYALYNTGNTTRIDVGSGKFSATAAAGTIVSTNGTAAATKQQLYGGYYKQNTNLSKYLPAGYGIETLPSGSAEYSEGYRYAIRPTTDVGTPVCKIGATPYTTLEEALEYANKNATSSNKLTILMVANYTLPAGNYTLPKYTTLLVPMKDQTSSIGTSLSRVTTAETRSCNKLLTLASGVHLTVYGTIETGAKQFAGSGATGYQTSSYGRIHTNADTRIDLEDGAVVYCWGYITGSGEIHAKDGSVVYEQFELGDFKGGGVASEMLNNSYKVFLITHYFYQSIEATVVYHPGSQALGSSTAAVNSSAQNANGVKIVGETNSGSLFLMDAKDARENTWLKKEYNPATERAIWTLNSGATLGNLTISISGANMQSANYILPISSQMDLKLNYGDMELQQNTYFMPGATFEIGREATLKIPSGKELYFIDQENWVKGYSVTNYLCTATFSPTRSGDGPRAGMKSSNTNIPDAEFYIHGTVEVTGSLFTSGTGANLHSTNADAGKVVFKSAAASNKTFYQCNSNCGKEGLLSYYWNRQEHACTSAKLKNGDDTYVSTSGVGAGTKYIYKENQWVKITTDGCLEVETVSGVDHKYAYTTEFVEVVANTSDNAYHDAAHAEGTEGCRYFVFTEKAVTSEGCVWWEVTKEGDGLYRAITKDHNDNINYYTYSSISGYWEVKTVTIKWMNTGNSVADYTVGYNTMPVYLDANPTKDKTSTEYYTWLGWTKGGMEGEFFAKDAELPAATENTTYYAYFQTNKFQYTITFKNYDEAVLEAKRWNAGEKPIYEGRPEKPATTAKEYTFDGWSTTKGGAKAYNADNLPVVSGTATYFAHYTESDRKYTVQWVNYDGTVLKEEKVAYNTTPSEPVEPTRPNDTYYTYTFDTWSPAVSAVTGNQTYTATYNYEKKVTKYSVTFKNGSTTVYSQNLVANSIPVFDGTTPTKDADAQYTYTFDGWSTTNGGALAYATNATLPALTANVTYYAHFSSSVNNYKVLWKSEDGKTLYETDASVPYNSDPVFNSANPTKARVGATVYTFDGWSATIGGAKLATLPKVTGDKVFYAHFSDDPVYVVTFNVQGHGSAPANQEIVSGNKVSQPIAPSETGYTFGGWYKETGCTNAWNFNSDVVTGNITLYAKWTAKTYTVAFNKNDAAATGTMSNQSFTYDESKALTSNGFSKTGYTFAGWATSANGNVVYSNGQSVSNLSNEQNAIVDLYAKWTEDKYSVTVAAGANGSVSPASVSNIGCETASGDITATANTGYQFTGWTLPEGVTAATNYTATSNPIRIHATASGKTITANFTARTDVNYTVKHWKQNLNDNDYTEVTADQQTLQGTTATATAATAKTYIGFTVQPITQGTIAGDGSTVVNIYYNRNTYTITWKDGDNKTIETDENMKYGATPTYNGATPTKSQTAEWVYTHNGWTPDIQSVTDNATYTATFSQEKRKYNVTWKGEGITERTDQVPYGDTPEYGTLPTKEPSVSEVFTYKWMNTSDASIGVKQVTSDVTYSGSFSGSPRPYTITFVNDNGTELQSSEVGYGSMPSYTGSTPVSTVNPSCTFAGWTPAIAAVGGEASYTATYKCTVDPIIVEANENEPVTVNTVTTTTTVKVQGTLNVSANLTTDDLILEATPTSSGEITGAGTVSVTTNSYFHFSQPGGFKARTWYAVAVPWQVDVPHNAPVYTTPCDIYAKKGEGEFAQLSLGSTIDLIYYDGEERAANGHSDACWKYVEDDGYKEVMMPGKAYMFKLLNEADTLRFVRKSDTPLRTREAEVVLHGSDVTRNKNWNGIANPATYHAYLDARENLEDVILGYIYDGDKKNYKLVRMDTTKLVVGQAVYIQAPIPQSIVANPQEYNNPSPSTNAAPRRVVSNNRIICYDVCLGTEDSKVIDWVVLRVDEDKEDEYVIAKDLGKFEISPNVAQMWVNCYDDRLAMNTLAPVNDQTVYPLGISVPQAGEYRLYMANELAEDDNLYLTYDGRVIWNIGYAPYVLSLEKGVNEHYGLRLIHNTPAMEMDVDQVETTRAAQKMLINQKVYILRGEQLYSITGQKAE